MTIILFRTAILYVMVASTMMMTTTLSFSPGVSRSNKRSNTSPISPLGMVGYGTQQGTRVDVSNEYAPRDIYPMQDWATQYGVQMAEGVQWVDSSIMIPFLFYILFIPPLPRILSHSLTNQLSSPPSFTTTIYKDSIQKMEVIIN